MTFVLAVVPERRLVAELEQIVRGEIGAELVIATSPDSAAAVIDARMPDVVLLGKAVSARQQSELEARLRLRSAGGDTRVHRMPSGKAGAEASASAVLREMSPAYASDRQTVSTFAGQIRALVEATDKARPGRTINMPQNSSSEERTTAQSRITAQGQVSVPASIRRLLGVGPGSVIEWDADGDRVIVRRAGRYSSEEIHRVLFPSAPAPKSLDDLKAGVRAHIRKRHARG